MLQEILTLTKAGVGIGEDGISSKRPNPLSTLITFELSKISPVLTSCKQILTFYLRRKK